MERREFVKAGGVIGGALSLGVSPVPVHAAPAAHPLRILILGGTSFLGPHLMKYALDRGHEVSTFTRGQTQPTIYSHLFREIEQLTGDRGSDLSALSGRRWDAVIDTSGNRVEFVEMSTALLRDLADVYVYTSSTGVYLPYLGSDLREDRTVLLEDRPEVPEDQRPSYGVMKSINENLVRDAFGPERAIVVRPTYIVGPADTQIHRFTYWAVRLRMGGEVLLPGLPSDPVQYVDVRDLTGWMIRLAESRTAGTFNVAGPASPLSVYEFAHGVRAATSSEVSWVEIPDRDFLNEHQVRFVIPWLMPVDDYQGASSINIDRAKAAGLTFRPLAQSAVDVLDWWDSSAVTDEQRQDLMAGPRSMIRRAPEIIAAWKAKQSASSG